MRTLPVGTCTPHHFGEPSGDYAPYDPAIPLLSAQIRKIQAPGEM